MTFKLLGCLTSASHFRTFRGHTGAVYEVAFAPDGHTLATTSADKTVIPWDPPPIEKFPGGEVRKACLRAGAALDEATWDQYAPGVSYQDTCADR
ncbi:MAG: WD40 repeat domain-containing protein [Pseudonocardiaceae bacterium]